MAENVFSDLVSLPRPGPSGAVGGLSGGGGGNGAAGGGAEQGAPAPRGPAMVAAPAVSRADLDALAERLEQAVGRVGADVAARLDAVQQRVDAVERTATLLGNALYEIRASQLAQGDATAQALQGLATAVGDVGKGLQAVRDENALLESQHELEQASLREAQRSLLDAAKAATAAAHEVTTKTTEPEPAAETAASPKAKEEPEAAKPKPKPKPKPAPVSPAPVAPAPAPAYGAPAAPAVLAAPTMPPPPPQYGAPIPPPMPLYNAPPPPPPPMPVHPPPPPAPPPQQPPSTGSAVVDKVCADLAAMGFEWHDAHAVVRQMQDAGEQIDLNVVIDRINAWRASQPSPAPPPPQMHSPAAYGHYAPSPPGYPGRPY